MGGCFNLVRPSRLCCAKHLRMRTFVLATSLILRCSPQASLEGRTPSEQASP